MALPSGIQWVTFDVYGTLIDWELGAYEAFKKEAERDGFTLERDLGNSGLYADTALNGDAPATRCGHEYFGTAHCLFASDAPFDPEQGRGFIAKTIAAVEALDIDAEERVVGLF